MIATFSLFWNMIKERVLDFAKALLIPNMYFLSASTLLVQSNAWKKKKREGGKGGRGLTVEDAILGTDINSSIRIQELQE